MKLKILLSYGGISMSFEPGGRSDKYGNAYEKRYFAKLLLRLIHEDITAVIVEPLGPNSNSVEFVTEQKDNTTKYYQCKARDCPRNCVNLHSGVE